MPDEPVLVVGAGPVGLTAALALRARGLAATVVEADPRERARPGSRALFVHRDSLVLLDALRPGLGARIAGHGVVWRTRRTLHRGRAVFERTLPASPPGQLPPFTSLRQADTEALLRAACVEAGVQFVWDAPVVDVAVAPDGVTLTAADGRCWAAPYVVAADGARSSVRERLGIALEGPRTAGAHVVVDVAGDVPPARVFHYEDPAAGGRTVLRVPFAGGFQVDLQCRDGEPPEALTGTVAGWLPAVEAAAERVLWVSAYRFRQVVAERIVDPRRRVLLAGEAAHLFPPFGARGMNSGIADAAAAAAAIAAGSAAAVDAFATDRRAAALRNRVAAATALAHLRPGRWRRAGQRAAARLAPAVPRLGWWLERAPYGPRGGY